MFTSGVRIATVSSLRRVRLRNDCPNSCQNIDSTSFHDRIAGSSITFHNHRRIFHSTLHRDTEEKLKGLKNDIKQNVHLKGADAARSLEHITEIYSDVEAKIMAKMRTHNKGRFRTALLTTVLAFIWVTNAFGKEIRSFVGGQTAEVARETLRHESIQIQTQELAMAVVNTLLNDPQVLAGTSLFLQVAANDPITQASILNLASHVLQHPDTLNEVNLLAKKLISQLVQDPEVISNFSDLAVHVLADLKTRAGFVKLISALTQDEEVYVAFLDLVNRIISEESVKSQVTAMISESSHNVLNDPKILYHSKEFVAEVMTDDAVQRTGGDALWRSVQYALQSRLLKAAGFTLACTIVVLSGRAFR